MSVAHKVSRLQEVLSGMSEVVVAYSGGADSAFLAEMAHRSLPGSCRVVTADSPSLKRAELQDAVAVAAERGWDHLVVTTHELDDERYASNPANRCYWCKTELMKRLLPIAGKEATILLGTNLDDLSDHRPGTKAAIEASARHPLVEAGFTKADVRAASRDLGLPTADKPAAACMSSRLAYGVRVTPQALARVERAEQEVIELGFEVCRVRDLGQDVARVEVLRELVPDLLARLAEVELRLRSAGFVRIEVDPKGYRQGALNELISIGRK